MTKLKKEIWCADIKLYYKDNSLAKHLQSVSVGRSAAAGFNEVLIARCLRDIPEKQQKQLLIDDITGLVKLEITYIKKLGIN